MNITEAQVAWQADSHLMEENGAFFPEAKAYLLDEFKRDYTLAMDALPTLSTVPNAGIPALLTTFIDQEIFKVRFAPNKAAVILGEKRMLTWLDETAMFPTVEQTGEVTSYGDYSESGHTGVNVNFTARQSYLYQTVKEYGDRELERMGLARISLVSEIDQSAALALSKFENLSYFFGVAGLQNYGLLNDPGLSAAITPASKAYGQAQWTIQASANEIYADIQALFSRLVAQTAGLVDVETKMVLAMSPAVSVALTSTNSFGVNVSDLIKKNFPNIRIETAAQYGVVSTSNPQGVAGGNFMQLIAEEIDGQKTGYCAFNEKMRAHPIVRAMSSCKQKQTAGTWGAVIRQPFAIVSMIGV